MQVVKPKVSYRSSEICEKSFEKQADIFHKVVKSLAKSPQSNILFTAPPYITEST